MAEGRICEFDDRVHYAKGLCFPHYRKLRQSGYVIGPPKPKGRPPAKCEQCGAPRSKSKGGPKGKLCTDCKLARNCAECGTGFTAEHPADTFCSDECKPDNYWRWWANRNPDKYKNNTQNQRDKRRERLASNGPREKFWRKTIYKRDNWICGLCGQPVDPDLKYPDPQSASLDHIVPLSEGGTHTKANSRLAHWQCNVDRGTGTTDEPTQLALV